MISEYNVKDVNNMKCWAFRIAEKKWRKQPKELTQIFDENKLYTYIDEGYDYMHLMSYDKVVDELKLILKNKGVII